MAWIEVIREKVGEALANILAVHSLNPPSLQDHHALYRTLMFGDSPLSRTEREAIAVVVSKVNGCRY